MNIDELKQDVESEEATPEEEAQYEEAFDFALRSLHSGEVAKNTVARVLNAQTPVKGIAEAVFVLVRRTEVQLDGIDDSVKIQIAEDLLEEILELMVESGRMTEGEITDEMIEQITIELYQTYAKDAEQRGTLDEDKIREDVEAGEGIKQPQGMNAMSNQEAKTRGLMDV